VHFLETLNSLVVENVGFNAGGWLFPPPARFD